MHEENFHWFPLQVSSSFDVGQILGDPVDLRSGVLRVACMMPHVAIQG